MPTATSRIWIHLEMDTGNYDHAWLLQLKNYGNCFRKDLTTDTERCDAETVRKHFNF